MWLLWIGLCLLFPWRHDTFSHTLFIWLQDNLIHNGKAHQKGRNRRKVRNPIWFHSPKDCQEDGSLAALHVPMRLLWERYCKAYMRRNLVVPFVPQDCSRRSIHLLYRFWSYGPKYDWTSAKDRSGKRLKLVGSEWNGIRLLSALSSVYVELVCFVSRANHFAILSAIETPMNISRPVPLLSRMLHLSLQLASSMMSYS